MITLADINQAYRNASETEKNEFINLILPKALENPAFEARISAILDASFNARLATSELRPIKRIAKLEQVTGLDDFGLDDEHELTIPERIVGLEEKIENFEFKPSIMPNMEIKIETKTEHRAKCLVDALRASKREFFTSRDVTSFLKSKLPESCKLKEDIQNVRKVKQDVLKKAVKMFPEVSMNKKTTGHKDVRLVLVS